MSDTVQKIKDRLNIVDVVGSYVKLTRAGRYYKGLSPFTKEKTPSFFVTPDRGLYHCFSSGKGGDMFTFVEEMEGVDFKGALLILAEKAGVQVEFGPGDQTERDILFRINSDSAAFFIECLKVRTDAKAYLEKRGVTQALADKWQIGYAPRDWSTLKDHLTKLGHTEALIERAGLIKRPDSADIPHEKVQRTYDRFRGRIMFPLKDSTGRIIAFSGRIFEDDPQHPQAKYINSPETPIFDKSAALYGIHEARNGIRTLGFSMLVEGQLDLVLAQSIGYANAVATSGTAFTDTHAQILKRYSPNLLIAYDGDTAGIKASTRAAERALQLGMNVKVATMKAGEDPADCILRDQNDFKSKIKSASHIVDFLLNHAIASTADPRDRKLAVSRDVVPIIAAIANKIDQAHFVSTVAAALSVPVDAVYAEVGKIAAPRPVVAGIEKEGGVTYSARDMLLGVFLAFSDAADGRVGTLTEIINLQFGENVIKSLVNLDDNEKEKLRMVAEEHFFMPNKTMEEQDRVLAEFQNAHTKQTARLEYNANLKELTAAEAAGDVERIQQLQRALTEIAKRL